MAESEVSEDSAELSEEAASDMTEFDVPWAVTTVGCFFGKKHGR